jgi:hypothetical protein
MLGFTHADFHGEIIGRAYGFERAGAASSDADDA